MQKQSRCVQFVPYEVVHRAAFKMDEEQRKNEVWMDEFEREYNVKFGDLTLHPGPNLYTMIFPSDYDYTMFILKWA